jgi:proliferating cell nuclear antigen PCNA
MVKLLDLQLNDSSIFKLLFDIISKVKDYILIEIICEENENDTKKTKKTMRSDKSSHSGDGNVFTKGILKIITLDSTKTSFIDLKLKSEYFNIFKSKNKTYDISISTVNFNKILKTMNKDDRLNMYIDSNDTNKLFIEIIDDDNNIMEYYIKLYDNEKKNLFPKFKFNAICSLNGAKFHKICNDMSKFAEDVIIDINKDTMTMSCDGYIIGGNMKLNKENITIKFNNDDIENITNKFGLKYFLLFEKCISYCDNIQMFFADNHPVCIKYILYNQEQDIGQIILGISPIDDSCADNFSDDDEVYHDNESSLKLKC